MNRRTSLKLLGSTAALLPFAPHHVLATPGVRRVRPSDAAWPSSAKWKELHDAVGGNLVAVDFPLNVFRTDPSGAAAQQLGEDLHNPYFVGDHPGLTQTLGWVDAWTSSPSVHAVVARNAHDIAAAVNFARENNLRIAVKGGGHSYQGTSNAPDSLLIWTRHMHDIALHENFVPQGCEGVVPPQAAVSLGAGAIWMQAYQAVTTKAGKYVQGGGCTTVGVAGLVQGGGFGSYSKHYGSAASSLLEAEVVTADGEIRIANANTNPDLFWALKGGGGGTFGVVSRLTLKVHDLPEYLGTANIKVQASSDAAYRRLLRKFVAFYREHLFNDHWGEQAHIGRDNVLGIEMSSHGLSAEQAKAIWKPFLDWVAASPNDYSLADRVVIGSIPARHWWDVAWWKENWPQIAFPNPNGSWWMGMLDYGIRSLIPEPVFKFDTRPGAPEDHAWWKGDGDQCSWFIWAYESLWLPDLLLAPDMQQRLADTMFEASRVSGFSLHFNKGLAGAPTEALARSRDTSTNPAVLSAFALVIAADGEGPAYPGIRGHEPDVGTGRKARTIIGRSMDRLRALAPEPGAYVSESNYFQKDWQRAYWGGNYERLAAIKQKYDPDGLFIVHNGVGSEGWSTDGFAKA
jgi:FAD/FMN-containing dehydrogenase